MGWRRGAWKWKFGIFCYSKEHGKQTTTKLKNSHHHLKGSMALYPVCITLLKPIRAHPLVTWQHLATPLLTLLPQLLGAKWPYHLTCKFNLQTVQQLTVPFMFRFCKSPAPSPHPSPLMAPCEAQELGPKGNCCTHCSTVLGLEGFASVSPHYFCNFLWILKYFQKTLLKANILSFFF